MEQDDNMLHLLGTNYTHTSVFFLKLQASGFEKWTIQYKIRGKSKQQILESPNSPLLLLLIITIILVIIAKIITQLYIILDLILLLLLFLLLCTGVAVIKNFLGVGLSLPSHIYQSF